MLNLLNRMALLCITDFPRLSSTSLLQFSSQLLLTVACFCLVCGYQSYKYGILIQARFHINRQLQCMVSKCNTYQRPCGILDLRLEQFTNTPISKYLYFAYPCQKPTLTVTRCGKWMNIRFNDIYHDIIVKGKMEHTWIPWHLSFCVRLS